MSAHTSLQRVQRRLEISLYSATSRLLIKKFVAKVNESAKNIAN